MSKLSINRNVIYVVALLVLIFMRLLVNELHYDNWLRSAHYTQAADFVVMLRGNKQFQSFIGGYVFPVFLLMVFVYWAAEEDKSRIPMQFMLVPLAYIPISIVGFTLVNAKFEVSYLYVNTLIILTFGYIYVGAWFLIILLLEKVGMVE